MTIEWSPDGRSITYSTAANAEPGVPIDLYVLDTDTGTTRMILEGGLYVLPAWSPAGDRIAFASDETIGAGRGRLHLVDPDGGHHVELSTDLVNPYLLSWSPDGRRLLSSPADSMDLLIVDPSTSIGPIRVARSDPYGAPSWQPLP
jgi:Tol biopolymer transport system component